MVLFHIVVELFCVVVVLLYIMIVSFYVVVVLFYILVVLLYVLVCCYPAVMYTSVLSIQLTLHIIFFFLCSCNLFITNLPLIKGVTFKLKSNFHKILHSNSYQIWFLVYDYMEKAIYGKILKLYDIIGNVHVKILFLNSESYIFYSKNINPL